VKVSPPTLTALDAPGRIEHAFLAASDCCAYLAAYLPGTGWRAGGCNQLIRNFKCEPSIARSNSQRRRHKRHAITTLARWLRAAVSREQAEGCTWVPIPPSKWRGDPDYDDRLTRTLNLAFHAYDVDVRGLLYQTENTVPDHSGTTRLSAVALYDKLCLDVQALSARPIRARIALFDDVLTTGKHYKCCERRLRQALPSTPITGVFLMRRVLAGRWRSLAW
jgi:predicted amidophosphoribosyltransferase